MASGAGPPPSNPGDVSSPGDTRRRSGRTRRAPTRFVSVGPQRPRGRGGRTTTPPSPDMTPLEDLTDDDEDMGRNQMFELEVPAGAIPDMVLFAATGLPDGWPPRITTEDRGLAGTFTVPSLESYINDGPRRPDEDFLTWRTRMRLATQNMELERRMEDPRPTRDQFTTEEEWTAAQNAYVTNAENRSDEHRARLDPEGLYYDEGYSERWKAQKRARQRSNGHKRMQYQTRERRYYQAANMERMPTPPPPEDSGDELFDFGVNGPLTTDPQHLLDVIGTGPDAPGSRRADSTALADPRCSNCIKRKRACDMENVGVPCTPCKENSRIKNDSCVRSLIKKPRWDPRCTLCAKKKKKCSLIQTGTPCDACKRAGVECVVIESRWSRGVTIPGGRRVSRSASPRGTAIGSPRRNRLARDMRSRSPDWVACDNCIRNSRVCNRSRPCASCVLYDERELCDGDQMQQEYRDEPMMTDDFAVFDTTYDHPQSYTVDDVEREIGNAMRMGPARAVGSRGQFAAVPRHGNPGSDYWNTRNPYADIRGLNQETNQNDNGASPYDVMMDGTWNQSDVFTDNQNQMGFGDQGQQNVPFLDPSLSLNPTPVGTAPQTPTAGATIDNDYYFDQGGNWTTTAGLGNPDEGVNNLAADSNMPSFDQAQHQQKPGQPPQPAPLSPVFSRINMNTRQWPGPDDLGFCSEKLGGPRGISTANALCYVVPAKACDYLEHDWFCTCADCHTKQNDYYRPLQMETVQETKFHLCRPCLDQWRQSPPFTRAGYSTGLCTCTGQLRKTWLCHQHRGDSIKRVMTTTILKKQDVLTRRGDVDTCPVCSIREQDPNSGAWACVACEEFVLSDAIAAAVAASAVANPFAP